MNSARVAAVAAAFVLASAASAPADTIRKIVVVENAKTTDDTVRYLAGVEEGDDFELSDIDTIRRELVSSGLFKDVQVFSEPVKGGVKVTIVAKDKHSWVIAPTVYTQPTNKGGGVGFGENNLFGENKKLLLYAQLATGDSFFIGGYRDPQIAGTPLRWQADLFLKRARVIEYAPPSGFLDSPRPVRQSKLNYLNGGVSAGVTLFRSATLNARLRGARVFYDQTELAEGAAIEDVTGDPTSDPNDVPDPGVGGWDVSTELELSFDRRANWYGISTGNKVGFSYERSLTGLGSDFDYWYAGSGFTIARRYFDSHNLILRGSVEYGEDVPFQHEFSSGGTRLRGYKNAQFRGDFKAGANAEYSVPMFTVKGFAFRALTFFDTRYTTFIDVEDTDDFRDYLPGTGDVGDFGFTPLKNSVGLGTRLYVRQIVLPLLGLDVGYGLEGGGYEIYFAVGLTDL